MKPLFNQAQKVLYKSLMKSGTIVTCFNQDDTQDVQIQGFRYYVDIKGQRWSIRESELSPMEKP